MPTYVIPAVYDTSKKYIRPIGRGELLLPEYFGIVLEHLVSENAGQSITVDSAGKLFCLNVSRDTRNLISQGSDKGAYLDASQILSNGSTNLLTTNPTDRRVILTKQTLLDAGLADSTVIYNAVQEHVAVISAAKEAAAASAAQAKTGASTVSRLITEAEAVVREEAAGIAAESITGQVVERAAQAASELVDNRQDREIAALTTRMTQLETKNTNEINVLNANWTQNFTQVTRTNVEQSEAIAQINDKNRSQDTLIADLQAVDVRHDERLNFLKCTTEALDKRIYQNFVCLINRIADAENRLNAHITTEVTRLDDEIRRINATQAAAWTTISRTLAEQAERIMLDEFQHRQDVEQINARIDDEVTRLEDAVNVTNAIVAENFAKVARTDAEQAEQAMQVAELCEDLSAVDCRLSESLVRQERINIEQCIHNVEFAQHQSNNIARFSDLSYASVVHTRELLSLDSGFVAACVSIISLVRMNLEQALMFFTIVGSTVSVGGSDAGSIVDFGDMG